MNQHHNYVVLFKDGTLKIGRTGNLRDRMRRYRNVYRCIEGRPVARVVARFVEKQIRQTFAGHTVPGTHEWFADANKDTLLVFAEMTARMQQELEAALA